MERGGPAPARGATKQTTPPASSRLTVKARPNRRLKQGSLWTRLPKPPAIADACGRALRRSIPALIGAGVLIAVSGTAWAGYQFVTTSDRFAITSIEVRGADKVAPDALVASLPAHRGQNVFAANLDAIASEARSNPWVAAANVHRELPHTIVVDLREHVATALVQLGGLYLVDADGHPFKKAELAADDGAGLPIITGLERTAYTADPAGTAATIRNALDALARWRTEQDRPSIGEVHLDTHGGLTLVTYENAITIQLGPIDESLGLRMQTFDATWSELSPTERTSARAIHLDARPDHVTVALAKKDQ